MNVTWFNHSLRPSDKTLYLIQVQSPVVNLLLVYVVKTFAATLDLHFGNQVLQVLLACFADFAFLYRRYTANVDIAFIFLDFIGVEVLNTVKDTVLVYSDVLFVDGHCDESPFIVLNIAQGLYSQTWSWFVYWGPVGIGYCYVDLDFAGFLVDEDTRGSVELFLFDVLLTFPDNGTQGRV